MAKKKVEQDYGDGQIDVLLGLEPIKRRPGMYVGELRTVDFTMGREIYENSGDEAQAGYCDLIKVSFSEKMTRMTVEDNGRGIPLGTNDKARNGDGTPMSTIKAIYTILHSGGKFGQGGYKVSGGLHGVGASVVNALSADFTAISRRDGKMRVYQSVEGYTVNADGERDENYDPPLIKSDRPADQTGMEVTFTINHQLPSLGGNGKKFDYDMTRNRLHELSFLIPGVTIELYVDGKLKEKFYSEDTSQHFVQMLKETGFELLHDNPLHKRTDNDDSTFVDMTIGFTDSTSKEWASAYTNTIHQPNGGTHVAGMMRGIFDGFIESQLYDEADPDTIFKNFEQQDIVRGSCAILHVGIMDAMYSSQDKKKLVTESAEALTYEHAKAMVFEFVENNWEQAVNIAKAAELRCENRKHSSRLKELNGKVILNDSKGGLQHFIQHGYTEALSVNPNERELYIVEGESAAGNMKRMRCKQTQAIQQLKGKIVNAERKSVEAVTSHAELGSVINAIQCGVDIACDIQKSRFSKIIIATDADSDGAHIRSMLITFFYRYMRPLVEAGMLYVVVPPLYGATNRRDYPDYTAFGQDAFELTYQIEEGARTIEELRKNYTEDDLKDELARNGWHITRYKGLGEMSDSQTQYTLCSKETRLLYRLIISENADDDDVMITNMMGDNPEHRRVMVGGVPHRGGIYEGLTAE